MASRLKLNNKNLLKFINKNTPVGATQFGQLAVLSTTQKSTYFKGPNWGALYLTEDDLKVIWAEFLTLSWTV